jgi:hypothetical protein
MKRSRDAAVKRKRISGQGDMGMGNSEAMRMRRYGAGKK